MSDFGPAPSFPAYFAIHPSSLVEIPTKHFQKTVKLPSGWTRVDEGIADFIVKVNGLLPLGVRTDFSCQGTPRISNSAYLALATTDSTWMETFLERFLAAMATSYPHDIEVIDNGEWGVRKPNSVRTKRSLPRTVFIERDHIHATKFTGVSKPFQLLYPRPTSRLVIRWTPEELGIVSDAFMRSLELH